MKNFVLLIPFIVNAMQPAHNGPIAMLFAAAKQHNPILLQEALRQGANPNARDEQQRTPLMYAAHWILRGWAFEMGKRNALEKQKDTIDLLLAMKADADAQDEKGNTALDFAFDENSFVNPHVFELLQRASTHFSNFEKKASSLFSRSAKESLKY